MLEMMMLAAAMSLGAPPANPPQHRIAPPSEHGAPPLPRVSGNHAMLPMTSTAGMPTIEVTINGRGPFKIGFDTGAGGGPHMTDRLATALALHPSGEDVMTDPSGRNPITVELYTINRATFGPVSVANWQGTAMPVRPGKLESLDAIIGLDAFSGYVVTLDYAAGHLSIDRGALPTPDSRHVFGYDDMIPRVPLTIEGHTIDAHLDTGNIGMGLIVPEAFAATLKHKADAKPAGQAHTVSNTIDMFALPIDGGAQVGTVALAPTPVGYPALLGIANIGSAALRGMVVRVDPANHRVELRPAGT